MAMRDAAKWNAGHKPGVLRTHCRPRSTQQMRHAAALFFQFASGLDSFRKKRTIVYLTALSLVVWALVAGAIWSIFRALGLDLPWGASVVALIVSSPPGRPGPHGPEAAPSGAASCTLSPPRSRPGRPPE